MKKQLWYFFENYITKGLKKELTALAIIYGTKDETRQQAFKDFGTKWIQYSQDEVFNVEIKTKKL